MITEEQIKEAMLLLPPDRLNDGCVYTSFNNGSHCIAGEILVNLGLTLPDVADPANAAPIRKLLQDWAPWANQFDGTAAWLLNVAQKHADNNNTWGHTIKYLCLNKYLPAEFLEQYKQAWSLSMIL